MPYVQRENGKVVGIWGGPQAGLAETFLPDDHAEVVAFRNPPVSVEDVGNERDRRLALGFNYAFGDARGVHHFATTERDRKGWDQVTRLKDTLIQVGDASPIKIWTETGEVSVTPADWNMIILYAATAFEQPLWAAAAALQKKTKIPADFRDDKYWPPV
jgi:hypothetical protein